MSFTSNVNLKNKVSSKCSNTFMQQLSIIISKLIKHRSTTPINTEKLITNNKDKHKT